MSYKDYINSYLTTEFNELSSKAKYRIKKSLKAKHLDNAYFQKFTDAYENYKSYNTDKDILKEDFARINFQLNKHKSNRRIYRYASVLLLCLSIPIHYFATSFEQSSQNMFIQTSNIQSESNIVLVDGSQIRISSNSCLYVSNEFNHSERIVHFSGKAFFNIAHNPQKPFVLTSGDFLLTVLGTRFGFEHKPNGIITTFLEEGSVEIDLQAFNLSKYILKPNENFTFNKHTKKLKISKLNASTEFDFYENKMSFNNQKLQEVFEDISALHHVKIEFKNTQIQQRRITGEFSNKSINAILQSLQRVVAFNFEIEDEKILITQNNKQNSTANETNLIIDKQMQ